MFQIYLLFNVVWAYFGPNLLINDTRVNVDNSVDSGDFSGFIDQKGAEKGRKSSKFVKRPQLSALRHFKTETVKKIMSTVFYVISA